MLGIVSLCCTSKVLRSLLQKVVSQVSQNPLKYTVVMLVHLYPCENVSSKKNG